MQQTIKNCINNLQLKTVTIVCSYEESASIVSGGYNVWVKQVNP